MTIIHSILLGIVQGLTEFIPVSSSGHLIIVRQLFSVPVTSYDLAFDAVLQLASALALIVFFAPTLWQIITTNRRMVGILALATVPAVVAGLFLQTYMESVFRSVAVVAGTLVIGSMLMLAAEYVLKRQNGPIQEFSAGRGLLVGLFQCLALVPGISRSGATISGGIYAGFNREQATLFSFYLAIPLLLGSGVKEVFELYGTVLSTDVWLSIGVGSIASFIVSIIAVKLLLAFVKTHTLYPFIMYRLAVALVLVVWFV